MSTVRTDGRLLSGKRVLPQLSPKQAELLRYLVEYSEANRQYPTQHELAARFGVTQARVYSSLKTLEAKGYITREPGSWRSLGMTEVARDWFELQDERTGNHGQQTLNL